MNIKSAKALARRDFANNDVAEYQSDHAIEQGICQDFAAAYSSEINVLKADA